MVREINIIPDFTPGFVGVGGEIPKFQYNKSITQEIKEGNLTPQKCLDILECMLLIRNFEQMIVELKEKKGKYGSLKYLYIGASHLSIGQEAIPTGAISNLRIQDCITSSHRGHGDSLAKGYFAIKQMDEKSLFELIESDKKVRNYLGLSPQNKSKNELIQQALQIHLFRAIAELFGKEEGYCHGRGGSMHIADFSKGHLGANAIVGGSLGMAVGAGIASRFFSDGTVVFSFTGDGAFNNGIAHESMNMANMAQFTNGLMRKKRGVPVIFGIVNNQYGMSGQERGEVTGIDFLSERAFGYNKQGMHAEIVNGMDVLAVIDAAKRAIDGARNGEGPYLLEFWCTRYKGHSLSDRLDRKEDETYRTVEELKAWEKLDPIENYSKKLVEANLVTKEKIEELKKRMRERNEAIAIKAAEATSPNPKDMYQGLFTNSVSKEVPDKFKQSILFHKPDFLNRDPNIEITYREAVIEALFEEMRRDTRVVLWGEDIADYGGAFHATEGLLKIFGRDRIFNTAISEAGIIGSGIGAALKGLRPVVEIMYIDFVLQAMDQLANQAAKWKYMSGGQPTIPLTIRTTIGGGKGYAGQHSQSLEAVIAHFPGLKIVMPSNAYEAKGLLKMAIRDNNPVVVIEHQNLYRHPRGKSLVPKDDYLIPFGKAAIRRKIEKDSSKNKITIISWSYMVSVALKAAERLSQEGVEAEVIDLRTLYPFDIQTLVNSVKKTGKALIVHQAVQFMGFGAEVAAQLQEKAFDYLDGPILRVAAPNTPPPAAPTLERAFLPNEDKIIKTVESML
ncbi:dehydrogenase E1 component subunit alpha/beta [Candidatus Aerophobetes bacterium]|nr:dehydrogenase E1 component subunit alpha/beta [Candidatus Aerophobetes bacterium]